MIRIDLVWLYSQPQDMRTGGNRLLAAVVNTVRTLAMASDKVRPALV